MVKKEHDKIAIRLAAILQKLNQGEVIYEKQLAEEFGVSLRTAQRDMKDRLVFLPLQPHKGGYRLDATFLGKFNLEDINRFASFASVRDLFGKIDQDFFQKYLNGSISIRAYSAERIDDKKEAFELVNQAIQQSRLLEFFYKKTTQIDNYSKSYEVQPYKLLNQSGVWYLIALHDDKIKTFSFTRLSLLKMLNEPFKPDPQIVEKIEKSQSIYFEELIDEVLLKIDAKVAVYFTRRQILPNQEVLQELSDGTLLLLCRKVHEQEILPFVQHWIPHIDIISPDILKQHLATTLQHYLQSELLVSQA